MKIQSIKNLSCNRTNTEIKRTKKDFENITFRNDKKEYSQTEGLGRGFLYGFLSFFGGIALLVAISMFKERYFFRKIHNHLN